MYEGIVKRKKIEGQDNRISGSYVTKAMIGFLVSIITGIVGLGGGYALVPSFIYLLNSPIKIAVGTSLASFISMAIVSGLFKLYQGVVDVMAAICLGIGTIIGAQIGAKLTKIIPTWLIKSLFGLVFLYISLKFVWQALILYNLDLVV